MKYILKVTDENDEGLRLDLFLTKSSNSCSRSHYQKMIKNKEVLVNNAFQKTSYVLKLGDEIIVDEKEKNIEILPENIPIEVLYEDENMAVINKPSGMITHPTEQETEHTLVNALLYKFSDNLSDLNGVFRRGIVHRLDRNTSGLLMIAKNNKTHEYLAEKIKNREIEKRYLAIAKGVFEKDEGVIDFPIGRNKKNPQKMAIAEDGKPSLTEYKVLERFSDCTYLELNLKTGRTHQIRVHLSSINHPILNDTMYGAGVYKVKTQEQVLQSYYLKFAKPFSDDIIEIKIEPDEKIKKVLNYLSSRK